MESPVVVDKPPEYHSKGSQKNNDKGFPFGEEESGEDGWSSLAARHPDIAARLRSRPAPAGWARKRRSSHNPPGQDTAEDFVSGLGEHFNRFPFDDIPTEFREHIPSHWGHRFAPPERTAVPEDSQHPQPQQSHPQPSQSKPPQNTISTQTDEDLISGDSPEKEKQETNESLPQYGLRNTVDLGQKTPIDPSLLDAESERNQRSMSAPPGNRIPNQQTMGNMMGGNPPPSQADHQEHNAQSNVRHIPIFVEGRDTPVINKAHPHHEPTVNAEPQAHFAPSPPERDQYFERDPGMGFHQPNFARSFGSPFNKGFRQGHQAPFAPQAAYQNVPPQGRSQSPKPQGNFTQIPVHHEPPKQQHYQHPQQPHNQHPQQQHNQHPQQQQKPQQQPQQQPQQEQQQAPPPQQSNINDPISKILNIQKDVLELMNEVENFTGKKSDKKYVYLDEMLTRNLIKLDDIETEGKENIRQARREAIKCIQKCINVLEAKADGKFPSTPQPNANVEPSFNGNDANLGSEQPTESGQDSKTKEEQNEGAQPAADNNDGEKPAESAPTDGSSLKTPEEQNENKEDNKTTPKKTKKVVKKRDKSKDSKEKKESGENKPTESKDASEKSADVDMKEAEGVQHMETEASVSSQ